MNSYKASDGTRYTQKNIDILIRKAKEAKLNDQLNEHGYHFCEKCGRSSDVHLDLSHDVSVKTAKETGRTELCWTVDNLTIRCRKCHSKYDQNDLQWEKRKH